MKMCTFKTLLVLVLSATVPLTVYADESTTDERQELLELKNTITNLIDELVGAGVLPEDKANLMKQTAAAKAKVEAEQEQAARLAEQEAQAVADKEAVRVQYVPEHVKEEIREEVRKELRKEVVGDVVEVAKEERWGVADALPGWIGRIKPTGDLRVRYEQISYTDTNLDADGDGNRDVAPDFTALNEAQQRFDPVLDAVNVRTPVTDPSIPQNEDQFFKERNRTLARFRERIRLGLEAEVNENMTAQVRVSGGNIRNPVSVNQDLGNDGERFDMQIDRAFLEYKHKDENEYDWLTLWAGRFGKPFFSSDTVFDRDLGFEGFAVQLKKDIAGIDTIIGSSDNSRTVFLNAGAFPLQEIDATSQDKWLFGGQIGTELIFKNKSRFKFAASYYDYYNVVGIRNTAQGVTDTKITFQENDYTAPGFMQGGNTLFDIRNDFAADAGSTVDDEIVRNSALYALASDYNILNLTASYDWASLSPLHVIVTGDFVKNLGYNKNEIIDRLSQGGNGTAEIFQNGVLTNPADIKERSMGYSVRMTVGWPVVNRKGRWHVFGGYKYLGRDAVLDSYTDSNFQFGGTNAKGFWVGGRYGLAKNTWTQFRWFSTDPIDGPDAGIDTLGFDLSTRF